MAVHGTAIAPGATRRLFTVDEYHRMGEAGVLLENERVELIAGEILTMAPIGSRHAASLSRCVHEFIPRVGNRAIARFRNPISLPPMSEPAPDVTLVRFQPDFYAAAHPGPDDILLLIEVSDSSLPFDRDVKLPPYAAAGIPEVWLADLQFAAIWRHTEPDADGYRQVTRFRRGDVLQPQAFPDLSIRVDDLLP